MCQDQSLPVFIQHIFAAAGIKDESGSRLTRFHQKMDFRVVAQRFEMTDALNDLSDRFLIYNISFAKFDLHAESFLYLTFQDLICTSPMTCAWISPSASFQTIWSCGSSSSSMRMFLSMVWESVPKGSRIR